MQKNVHLFFITTVSAGSYLVPVTQIDVLFCNMIKNWQLGKYIDQGPCLNTHPAVSACAYNIRHVFDNTIVLKLITFFTATSVHLSLT